MSKTKTIDFAVARLNLIQSEILTSRPPLKQTVLGVFDFAKIIAGGLIIKKILKPFEEMGYPIISKQLDYF